MNTSTANQTSTVQERFESAVDGLRSEGIKVVLNHKSGMEYGNDAIHGGIERIAYTDTYPALGFNDEGNPVVGSENELEEMSEGSALSKVVIHHLGDRNVVADTIAEKFAEQGFQISKSTAYYVGVTIRF